MSELDVYAQTAADDWAQTDSAHVEALADLEGYRVLVHAAFDRIVELETDLAKTRSTLRAVNQRLRQVMNLEPWHSESDE